MGNHPNLTIKALGRLRYAPAFPDLITRLQIEQTEIEVVSELMSYYQILWIGLSSTEMRKAAYPAL